MPANLELHKHPVPESTFRDYVENVLASYLTRRHGYTPHDITSQQEIVDAIVKVAECPVCSRGMKIYPEKPITVLFKKLSPSAKSPEKKDPMDAGYDIFALHRHDIQPGETQEIRTGLAFEPPPFIYFTVNGKSTFGSKAIHTYRGIVDAGYRGELSVFMTNGSRDVVTIQKHQKFAQLIFHYIMPVNFVVTDELSASQRGEGKQGSTGKF